MVAEGAPIPQQMDRMFEINTGSAGGPFRMMDQVGLDVVLEIEEHYCAETLNTPKDPVGCCVPTSNKACRLICILPAFPSTESTLPLPVLLRRHSTKSVVIPSNPPILSTCT